MAAPGRPNNLDCQRTRHAAAGPVASAGLPMGPARGRAPMAASSVLWRADRSRPQLVPHASGRRVPALRTGASLRRAAVATRGRRPKQANSSRLGVLRMTAARRDQPQLRLRPVRLIARGHGAAGWHETSLDQEGPNLPSQPVANPGVAQIVRKRLDRPRPPPFAPLVGPLPAGGTAILRQAPTRRNLEAALARPAAHGLRSRCPATSVKHAPGRVPDDGRRKAVFVRHLRNL
jgi:hypothetical protein